MPRRKPSPAETLNEFIARTSREVREREPYWLSPEKRKAYWEAVSRGDIEHPADFYNC